MFCSKTALAAICALSLATLPVLAAPQPDVSTRGQNPANGLFPSNEPMPMYRTGRNNPNASLYHPGGPAPNAGNTGLNGSAGSGRGWTPPANYGGMTSAPQR